MESRNQVSLAQWISGAIQSIKHSSLNNNDDDQPLSSVAVFGPSHHDPKTLALSSDAFLSATIKVAKCLANEICISQQQHGDGEQGVSKISLPLPGLTDWADSVVVHLSSSSSEL